MNRVSFLRSRHGWLSTVALGCAMGVSMSANADLAYGVRVGVGHSDNIARTPDNEIDETIGTAGVNLTWNELSRRLDANVGVDLSYFEYFEDTFEGQLMGTVDGTVVVGLVPERFTWLFQDSFGQVQADPFAPATPDTIENVNYFTTGPDFTLRLGSAASLRLFGRYSSIQYETSPLDGSRAVAGFALARRLSSRSEFALNALTESVEFDDVSGSDFDRESVFLSYGLQGGRTALDVELGYSWIERADGQTDGGALARLGLSRQISESSSVFVSLGTETTDGGDALRDSLGGQTAVGGTVVAASADPFENRTASVGWNFARNRTSLGLSAGWNQERYERQTALDRTTLLYSATATRQLARSLNLDVAVSLSDEEFDTTGLGADELHMQTILRWQPGRYFEYALTLERFDRDTSNGTGDYVENRAFLTIGFSPRRPVR